MTEKNESVEVRIARIEEAVKSQSRGVQDIKEALNGVVASLKEMSKQMVEANTSTMAYFTTLSTKHQAIDEKVDRFNNNIHALQKDKMDEKHFQNYKALKKTEEADKTDKIYKYIDKVETGIKTQLDTNSALLTMIEKYQVEQKGGYKYIIGSVGIVSTLLGVFYLIIKIGNV
jgi:chromosome segregation ATPase